MGLGSTRCFTSSLGLSNFYMQIMLRPFPGWHSDLFLTLLFGVFHCKSLHRKNFCFRLHLFSPF